MEDQAKSETMDEMAAVLPKLVPRIGGVPPLELLSHSQLDDNKGTHPQALPRKEEEKVDEKICLAGRNRMRYLIPPQELDDINKATHPEALPSEEKEKVDEMAVLPKPVSRMRAVPPPQISPQQLDYNKASHPEALPWEQEVPLKEFPQQLDKQDNKLKKLVTHGEIRRRPIHDEDKSHSLMFVVPASAIEPQLDEQDDNNKATHPKDVYVPFSSHGCYFDGRRIYRVPPQLMRMNKDSYAPRMVSFGPYNNGLPEPIVAEEFKLKVVDMFLSQTHQSREELFDNVFQVIDQIRLCYDCITKDVFKDVELAEIILRDTLFLIYLMQRSMKESKLNIETDKFLIEKCLGSAAIPFLYTDMLLLDNQIPLSIINLFISLLHHNKEEEDQKEDGSSLVLRYILKGLLMDRNKITSFPAKDGKQPLHLLDACWRLTAEEYSNVNQVQLQVDQPDAVYGHTNRPFRSVSDLKAKGVHFKRIDSQCVRHIMFDSWIFFAKLQLPILSVDASAKVINSNLIAYEMSPVSTNQLVITSYINFMKSLLITPKDVKELREKEILFSTHDSDEHVIKQFKEIDTYGLDNPDIFSEVKNKIEKHCKGKMGLWMVELIYTYFRSPWTFIALVAATILLCLTFIQTYFTVNPAS